MGVVVIGGDDKLYSSLAPAVARLGHEATHASDPTRVVAACCARPEPLLAVLSLRLVRGSGVDLLAALAPQRARGLHVVVILPVDRAADQASVVAAGAAAALRSPLRLSLFVETARRLLAGEPPPEQALPAARPPLAGPTSPPAVRVGPRPTARRRTGSGPQPGALPPPGLAAGDSSPPAPPSPSPLPPPSAASAPPPAPSSALAGRVVPIAAPPPPPQPASPRGHVVAPAGAPPSAPLPAPPVAAPAARPAAAGGPEHSAPENATGGNGAARRLAQAEPPAAASSAPESAAASAVERPVPPAAEAPPAPRPTDSGIRILATQPPAPASSLRSAELFDTQPWPTSKPPLGPLRAALVARVADPLAVPGVEPGALSEIVKQLNGAEVRALRLLAERVPAPLEAHRSEPPPAPGEPGPAPGEAPPPADAAPPAAAPTDAAPAEAPRTAEAGIRSTAPDAEPRKEGRGYSVRPEEAEPLVDALAHRLRVLLLGAELDRLRAAETPLEPNEPLLAELIRELQEAGERLHPLVERAMKSHDDADLLRAAGASRTALLRAAHQLENLGRRARGDAEKPLDLRQLVEAEAQAAPVRKRRGIGRIIVLSTQQVARRLADRRLLYALGVIAVATLLVHTFVLGSFDGAGRRGQWQRPAPAGTREVVDAPDSVRVFVSPGFDLRAEAARVRKELGPDARPVIFLDPTGVPVGAAHGAELLLLPEPRLPEEDAPPAPAPAGPAPGTDAAP